METTRLFQLFSLRYNSLKIRDEATSQPQFKSAIDRRIAAAKIVTDELEFPEVLSLLAELASDDQIAKNRSFEKACRTVLMWWVESRGKKSQDVLAEMRGDYEY